jgi:hypothetical protein
MNPAVDHPRAHPQRGGQFLAAQQPVIRRSCGSAKASWTCQASRTSPSASPHATASTRGGRAGRATSVADPTPAGPPPGGAAWRRTRPFRLRRSRRPIRSLQRPGKERTRATAEGPDPPEGPHRGRISSVAPVVRSFYPGVCRPQHRSPPRPGVFTQCSCRSASIQRHHDIRLVRLVGAPRPPWRTDQPSGRSSALRPELSADAQSGPGHDPGTFRDPGVLARSDGASAWDL